MSAQLPLMHVRCILFLKAQEQAAFKQVVDYHQSHDSLDRVALKKVRRAEGVAELCLTAVMQQLHLTAASHVAKQRQTGARLAMA